jgi:hypothetical protein
MKVLRDKFSGEKNYNVPKIVFIDRSPEMVDEKELLEKIVSQVNNTFPKISNRWKSRLFDLDPGNFLGVWFEIMLYDWLTKFGDVFPEPHLSGQTPDFLLRIKDQEIIIESTVARIGHEERTNLDFQNNIMNILDDLSDEIGIDIDKCDPIADFVVEDFYETVINHIKNNPSQLFSYPDREEKIILRFRPGIKGFVITAKSMDLDPSVFTKKLFEKKGKYKVFNGKTYPYIIAIYSEGFQVLEKLMEAWHGTPHLAYNGNMSYLGVLFDNNGVENENGIFTGENVSGFLFSQRAPYSPFKGNQIEVSYFPNENCLLNIQIHNIFPVHNLYSK